MTGGEVRYQSGLVDALVGDGVNAVKAAMNEPSAKAYRQNIAPITTTIT